MAGFGGILKAILTLDNKQFSDGLKKSQKETKDFEKSFSPFSRAGAIFGGLTAVAGAVLTVGKNMAQTSVFIKNATIAFKRFGDDAYLRELELATGNQVNRLKLMQQSIQAVNLGLRASDLPTFFRFASIRAAETGVHIDYLVNSIVTGVGRESRLVLDNLGISLKELNEEIQALGGGFTAGAVSLINKKFEETNRNVSDTTSGIIKLQVSLENLWNETSSSEAGSWWDNFWDSLAKGIEGLTQEGRLRGMKLGELTLEQLRNSLQALKKSGLITEFAEEIKAIQDEIARRIGTYGPPESEVQLFGLIEGLEEQVKSYKRLRGLVLTDSYEDLGLIDDYNKKIAQLTLEIRRLKGELDGVGITPMKSIAFNSELPQFETPDYSMMQRNILGVVGSLEDMAQAYVAATMESREFAEVLTSDTEPALLHLGETLADITGMAIQSFVSALQRAIETGDVLGAFSSFLGDLGQLLMQYGAAMVAFGVGQKLLETGDAFSKIAGGAIMIAAGAALTVVSASIQKGGSTGSFGSGYYGGSYGGGSGSSGYGGSYDYNREITMVARGEDLVSVINRQNYRDGNYG